RKPTRRRSHNTARVAPDAHSQRRKGPALAPLRSTPQALRIIAEVERPLPYDTIPNPETSAWRACFTCLAPASPFSCLTASTTPIIPPPAPHCPADSCPPPVFNDGRPSSERSVTSTYAPPPPFAQNLRSSSWISVMIG